MITLKNSGGNRLLVLLDNGRPAVYKCSYSSLNEPSYDVLVYLTLNNGKRADEKENHLAHVDNKTRLSATTNETKVAPAVTSRNGEQVLINVLSWVQNTYDFYVELLRVKGSQMKKERVRGAPQNRSEVSQSLRQESRT